MDSVNIKPSGSIINTSNNTLATAINSLIDKVSSDSDGERTIQISLNIDNFNNNRTTDVKQLMSEITDTVKSADMIKRGKRS